MKATRRQREIAKFTRMVPAQTGTSDRSGSKFGGRRRRRKRRRRNGCRSNAYERRGGFETRRHPGGRFFVVG